MTAWGEEDLGRIGDARELQLASVRPDGTLRPYVTMWVVRADDKLYVRSAYGPDDPWFRRAKASGGRTALRRTTELAATEPARGGDARGDFGRFAPWPMARRGRGVRPSCQGCRRARRSG